jgi:hypothetical protein
VLAAECFGKVSTECKASPSRGDWFGQTLAAGDFNGDGYADLAISVAYEDSGAIDSGTVHVLYSTRRWLTGTGSVVFEQGTGGVPDVPEYNDTFGATLEVGDLNGDGRADLAIAALGENVGIVSRGGMVLVLFGRPTGLTTAGARQFRQGDGQVGDTPERRRPLRPGLRSCSTAALRTPRQGRDAPVAPESGAEGPLRA